MGQCCVGHYETRAEEFVNKLLTDPSFKLNSFSYNELLNELADIRSETNGDSVSKSELEKLSKKFYSKNENNYQIYYINILKDIMFQLESPKTSMYKFLLYLFPFIKHNDEEIDESMYFLFKYFLKFVSLSIFSEWLNKYILFCTQGVNHSIWEKCEDHEIASALDDLNTNIYTRENIKQVCKKIVDFIAKKGVEPQQEVTLEIFKEVFQKWDLSTIQSVREIVTRDIL